MIEHVCILYIEYLMYNLHTYILDLFEGNDKNVSCHVSIQNINPQSSIQSNFSYNGQIRVL